MAYIFLNLKRFDITPDRGGVNRIAPPSLWAEHIIRQTASIGSYPNDQFVSFFPEAHLLPAVQTRQAIGSPMAIGCQGCAPSDTSVGGNFGAFTAQLTANSAAGLGCDWALIGHCEERSAKAAILASGGGDPSVVSHLLNGEILRAQAAGLKVLYCIGEKFEELDSWQDVLRDQLKQGLEGVDLSRVVIAYEPIWAIGPGKTPPDRARIQKTAQFIRSVVDLPVVYGGGLKLDNAPMLAGIPEISGGLIALTRFSGEIGFYPEEYLAIADAYLGGTKSPA